ncbi:MAG: hypothetical protein ACRBCS_05480 [Cellvibrionaceae bacterium]
MKKNKIPLLLISYLFFSPFLNASSYEPPRMPNGKPSLQGIWSNVSVTDLQRKEGVKSLVLSPQEAAALEGKDFYNIRTKEDAKPNSKKENETLLDGSDLLSGGGYNAFWVDAGTTHGVVKGEIRSSWIVDPDNGRIPYTNSGREKISTLRDRSRANDGPEGRTMSDRCLIGFGGTGGPPMLNVLYNNTYQFVQTDDYLMILVEMAHDARIIRINQQHNPANVTRWLGDSIGYWEGDTFVVETKHWNSIQANRGPIYHSQKGKVIERFSRYSDNQIFYEFTIDDPEFYSQPWRGEMSFNSTEGPVYEYACHEGNIALPGILKGARHQERLGNKVDIADKDEG